MKKALNYSHTIYACFVGYVVQAIVVNFTPLLFLTFQDTYGISLDKITLLVTFNFVIQLLVDFASVRFVDRIGYKVCAVAAHLCAALGLAGLTVLPQIMDPFNGLFVSVAVYAMGGGLLEVLLSPIVEACPTERKEAAMSLLHSFYCWGHVGVVLVSTAYFVVFGIDHWRYLALFWALIPILNAVYFARVPIEGLIREGDTGMTLRQLMGTKVFWVMMLLMLCAGACELGVSQWASAFAESALGISKTLGDLTGPLLFAVLMGTARAIYGKYSERLPLQKVLVCCGILCLLSYLLASLSVAPILGFAGCALCGFSVGIMWPGTLSMAAADIRGGGTAMFALLALAGDVGCSGGPTLVGFVSGMFHDDLKKGILAGTVFPILLLFGLFMNHKLAKGRGKACKSV